MAAHLVTPATGAVVLPTGFNGLFQGFTYGERVATEETTAYGTPVYGTFVSNATPVASGTATGFVRAGASSMNPGFGANTDNDGGAATFTLETNSTIAGNIIIANIQMQHSRVRGAVSCSWDWMNSGDMTVTVATS